jgi:S1-C subfamily serine protease
MRPSTVLTNAHVVAGVAQPTVRDAGGRSYDARVVAYDPRRDLAVLHVPLLEAPILRFDATAKRGDNAVVAGFPRGGPYRLDAARVREEISARGPDIYGRTQVTRSVFSLYTTVQPGNSGGPLLSPRRPRLRRHLRQVGGRQPDRLRADGRGDPARGPAGGTCHAPVETGSCAE